MYLVKRPLSKQYFRKIDTCRFLLLFCCRRRKENTIIVIDTPCIQLCTVTSACISVVTELRYCRDFLETSVLCVLCGNKAAIFYRSSIYDTSCHLLLIVHVCSCQFISLFIIRSAPSESQTVFYIDMMLDEQNIFEILVLKSDLICFSCPMCILCHTVVIIFVIKTIHAELESCETTLN